MPVFLVNHICPGTIENAIDYIVDNRIDTAKIKSTIFK
jgi:hypothetical protein